MMLRPKPLIDETELSTEIKRAIRESPDNFFLAYPTAAKWLGHYPVPRMGANTTAFQTDEYNILQITWFGLGLINTELAIRQGAKPQTAICAATGGQTTVYSTEGIEEVDTAYSIGKAPKLRVSIQFILDLALKSYNDELVDLIRHTLEAQGKTRANTESQTAAVSGSVLTNQKTLNLLQGQAGSSTAKHTMFEEEAGAAVTNKDGDSVQTKTRASPLDAVIQMAINRCAAAANHLTVYVELVELALIDTKPLKGVVSVGERYAGMVQYSDGETLKVFTKSALRQRFIRNPPVSSVKQC
jgi:hypothetical protein